MRAFAYHEPVTGDFVIMDDCSLVPFFNYPTTPRAGPLLGKFTKSEHLFVLYRSTGMYSLLLGAPQQLEHTVGAGQGASRRVNHFGRCASDTFYYSNAQSAVHETASSLVCHLSVTPSTVCSDVDANAQAAVLALFAGATPVAGTNVHATALASYRSFLNLTPLPLPPVPLADPDPSTDPRGQRKREPIGSSVLLSSKVLFKQKVYLARKYANPDGSCTWRFKKLYKRGGALRRDASGDVHLAVAPGSSAHKLHLGGHVFIGKPPIHVSAANEGGYADLMKRVPLLHAIQPVYLSRHRPYQRSYAPSVSQKCDARANSTCSVLRTSGALATTGQTGSPSQSTTRCTLALQVRAVAIELLSPS